MSYLNKIRFVAFELFHLLGIFITGYILLVLAFAPFSVDKEITRDKKEITILCSTSGIHTDVVLPIHHSLMDWEKTLDLSKGLAIDTFQTHLKFGWGDRNFFLKTKNWSDLTAGTLIKTVFGSGPGAMHLVLCTPKDLDSSTFFKLQLTKKQYLRLCIFVRGSFEFKAGKAKQIIDHPYGNYEFFFESTKEYSMAYTCNSWTNDALKAAGQKACVWTPFKTPIWAKYKP